MKWLNLIPQRLDRGATPTFAGLLAGDGTAAAPSISFANSTNMGFFRYGPNDLGVSVLGATSFIIGSGGTLYGANGTARLTLPAAGSIGLVAAGTNQSITLTPSGTGQVSHIGLSNFSDTLFFGNSSGSYGRITWGSALTFQAGAGLPFTLVSSNGTEVARGFANGRFGIGTGTADSGALLQVGANFATGIAGAGMSFGGDNFLFRDSAATLRLNNSGTSQSLQLTHSAIAAAGLVMTLTSANASFNNRENGSLSFATNNVTALTLDVAQNATFAASVNVLNTAAIRWTSWTQMLSPADGVIRLTNAAGSDFTRLQFGGVTASFPALKRSSTALHVKLADDSAFAPLAVSVMVATGSPSAVGAGEISYSGATATTVGAAGGASALPATPTGYIIVNVAGTQMKVPYYAN